MTPFYISEGVLRTTPDFRPLAAKEPLLLSVTKWRVILDHLLETGEMVKDGGAQTCALCKHYTDWDYEDWESEDVSVCHKCPIVKAGNNGCLGTGYEDYIRATTVDEAIKAAKRELEMLRGLLDQEMNNNVSAHQVSGH